MSLQYGLTPQGFVLKPVLQIVAEKISAYQAAFGAGIPTNVQSRNGQFITIWSVREEALWEIAQLVYSSQDPDQAVGTQLDSVCALTGTQRKAPSSSSVTQTLTGVPGTIVPASSSVAVPASGNTFSTLVPETIVLATAWTALTLEVQGARVTNGGNVYQSTSATGTTGNTGGPTGTGSAIVDGSVTWMFLGQGMGSIDVLCASVLTGPIQGSSGTITQIVTPISGWQGTINVLDAVLGTNLETDAALRVDRDAELNNTGAAVLLAIQDAVLGVVGVTACTVFENISDVVDANGLPPHAIEAVVQGGANQDIWNAIFKTVGAGINDTHGNTVGTVTDSQGQVHTVAFTRPTPVNIYVIVNLSYDSTGVTGTYPVNGNVQVANNILSYGAIIPTGFNVFAGKLISVVEAGIPGTGVAGIPGVLDTAVLIGTSPSPVTSTPVVIGSRQIAAFDSSRITVNATPTTP